MFFLLLWPAVGAAAGLQPSTEFDSALHQLPKVKKSAGKETTSAARQGNDGANAQDGISEQASLQAKGENLEQENGEQQKVTGKSKSVFAGASGEMVSVGDASGQEYKYVVNVSDFGAVPNDGIDDANAIRRALASVAGKSGVRLVFGMGVYDLYNFDKGYAGVLFEGFDNIMIDGGGATFVIYSSGSHMRFENCSNVVLANIDFDCKKAPFIGGKVAEVYEDGFACAVPYGQEILEHPPKAVNLYNADKNEFIAGYDLYQNTAKCVEDLGGGKMRVPVEKGSEMPKVGDDVVVRYQVYGFPAVSFSSSSDVRIYNVNIWSHPGIGVYAEDSRDIFMDNVNVVPKSDAVWMTTTADAVQLKLCRGLVDISNCRFERCGGDALNIHQPYWIVSEIVDSHAVKLVPGKKRAGFNIKLAPKKMDELGFGAEDNWLRVGFESDVVSVAYDEKEKFVLAELSKPVPDYVTAGMPVWNMSSNPKVRVSRSSVVSTRARGASILTHDVKIENCEFVSTLYPAIIFECDNSEWFEGCAVDDVVVSSCYFENCNKFEVKYSAAIYAGAKFCEGAASGGDVHGAIRVEKCKFEKCSDTPIFLDMTLRPYMKSNIVFE